MLESAFSGSAGNVTYDAVVAAPTTLLASAPEAEGELVAELVPELELELELEPLGRPRRFLLLGLLLRERLLERLLNEVVDDELPLLLLSRCDPSCAESGTLIAVR
jgi:hypothetical protein